MREGAAGALPKGATRLAGVEEGDGRRDAEILEAEISMLKRELEQNSREKESLQLQLRQQDEVLSAGGLKELKGEEVPPQVQFLEPQSH